MSSSSGRFGVVTPNDPEDGDSGPNNLQNFPVLATAVTSAGSTTIDGSLNSTPSTMFLVEFFSNSVCDPSGFGEGESFLGSGTVITDGSGNGSFSETLPTGATPGQFVTATATDLDGNTSEFSACGVEVIDVIQVQEEIINDLIDLVVSNPGTPLADKVEDAAAQAQSALDELNKTPPDNQAALGNLEGAVGDLEAAVNEGLDAAQGAGLMDDLAGVARQLAAEALAQAIALGGDPDVIADAKESFDEGDALRASGAFKGAVSEYKDALAKAESVLP